MAPPTVVLFGFRSCPPPWSEGNMTGWAMTDPNSGFISTPANMTDFQIMTGQKRGGLPPGMEPPGVLQRLAGCVAENK